MATDLEIKQTYDAMRAICRETSQLLTVIHDQFVKRRFRVVNSAIIWGTSAQYSEPDYWMPYFQQLVFVGHGEPDPKRGVGVNVMFDDPKLQNVIPFMSCGMATWSKGHPGKSNGLYDAGWNATEILVDFPLYTSRFAESKEEEPTEVINYFLPLTAISSEAKVSALIIQPLANMLAGDRAEAIRAIEDAAIPLEVIKGQA